MPHVKREKAETGFYHAVSKGDGGRIIFEGDRDRSKYLELLDRALDEHQMQLHAYCLMSNHVHLLLRDSCDNLSAFMKELNESYARYFAWSTGRVGHVFQGRFWSEPVDTNERFLTTLRYVHANPEPARICRAEDYPWSSYCAYVAAFEGTVPARLPCVEVELALSLLGGAESFTQFSKSGGSYPRPFPESRLKGHLSADELANVAVSLLGRDVLNQLPSMSPRHRADYFVRLSQAGFRCNEIARVSGVGQASISRSLKTSMP